MILRDGIALAILDPELDRVDDSEFNEALNRLAEMLPSGKASYAALDDVLSAAIGLVADVSRIAFAVGYQIGRDPTPAIFQEDAP